MGSKSYNRLKEISSDKIEKYQPNQTTNDAFNIVFFILLILLALLLFLLF